MFHIKLDCRSVTSTGAWRIGGLAFNVNQADHACEKHAREKSRPNHPLELEKRSRVRRFEMSGPIVHTTDEQSLGGSTSEHALSVYGRRIGGLCLYLRASGWRLVF